MEYLYQLIQIYLGHRQALDEPLTEEQWFEVYEFAKKQSVLGIIQYAAEKLPEEQKPSRRVKIRLALISEKIQKTNVDLDNKVCVLYKQLQTMGRRSCLLKGQGVAQFYPTPNMRQSGDIDMWVEGDRESIIQILRTKWPLGDICYHHCDTHVFEDNTTKVEIHFMPSWMNNPFKNRILQSYFREHGNEQFANYYLDLGYARPTSSMNCVSSMMHIYRHVLFEGIGLRQLLDYYFILINSQSEDRLEAKKLFDKLGMLKFVSIIMYILHEKFGLEQKYMICPASSKHGDFLIREIELSGNFGQTDSRNKSISEKNMFKRAFYRMLHVNTFFKIAPSEVLWAPLFNIWHYIWRKVNKY